MSMATGEITRESTPHKRKVRLSESSGLTRDSIDAANRAVLAGSICLIFLSESFCLHPGKKAEANKTANQKKRCWPFFRAALSVFIMNVYWNGRLDFFW